MSQLHDVGLASNDQIQDTISQFMKNSGDCGKWIDTVWESNYARNLTETAQVVWKFVKKRFSFQSTRPMDVAVFRECFMAMKDQPYIQNQTHLVLNSTNLEKMVQLWASIMSRYVNQTPA